MLKPEHRVAAGAAYERLSVFIGQWHAEGKSYAVGQTKSDPRGSVEKWISDENYEWLPGKFFVMQTWDARTGKNPFKGTAIISHDAATGTEAMMRTLAAEAGPKGVRVCWLRSAGSPESFVAHKAVDTAGQPSGLSDDGYLDALRKSTLLKRFQNLPKSAKWRRWSHRTERAL